MRKLVLVPNAVLTKKTHSITRFDTSLKKLIQDMIAVLEAQYDPPGVGLAGPQVGVNKAVFIMKPKETAAIEIVINPKIIQVGKPQKPDKRAIEKQTELEGCLSIPFIWSPIHRARSVQLSYQDESGQSHITWFRGFRAVIVQHEVDHLNGIVFTQRALEQNAPLYREDEGSLERIRLG